MTRVLEKTGQAACGFWLAYLFLKSFLAVNEIGNQQMLWFALGIMGALVLILTLLHVHWAPTLLLMAIVQLLTTWWLLPYDQSLSWAWMKTYFGRLKTAITTSLTSGSAELTATLSVTLALLALALIFMLSCYWSSPELSVLIVFSYLLAVHIFNGNELTSATLQLALIFCISRAWRQWWAPNQGRRSLAPLLPIVLVLAVWGATIQLPAINTQLAAWSADLRSQLNQVGFYESIERYARGASRTGFSEDDNQLGGPLYDDPTAVVKVRATQPHYLRIQVKTDYTGQGWRSPTNSRWVSEDTRAIQRYLDAPRVISDGAATVDYANTSEAVRLTALNNQDYIGLPYGQIEIEAIEPGSLDSTFYDNSSQRLYGNANDVKQLQLGVHAKKIVPAELAAMAAPTTTNYTEELALPSSLPVRVRRLAVKLTEKIPTYYGKVMAIEDYLADSADLVYSKIDTPALPQGRDYVDYFLFDSQVGYCDNFSTAMVVLLRSIGIPARWAKGFAPGTVTKTLSGDQREYTVTNSDAHAWPEVYFGEYGWLPFEPTPGFTNSDEVTTTTSTATNTANSSSVNSSTSSRASSRSKSSSQRQTVSSSEDSATSTRRTKITFNLPGWLQLVIWLALIALILLLLPKIRPLILWIWARQFEQTNFSKFYRYSLRGLQPCWRRPASQSLSAYAQEIDQHLGLAETFSQITEVYQAQTFGQEIRALPPQALRQFTSALLRRSNWRQLMQQHHH